MKPGVVFLQPGGWFFSENHAVVETILGSCLGIVMRGGGASCVAHCILPHWGGEVLSGNPCRFVDSALAEMVRLFEKRGIGRNDLEVKLFGGAGILPGSSIRPVGRHNIETAVEILQQQGIRVMACQVGGDRGRRIQVHTESGDVFVKTLRRSQVQFTPTPTPMLMPVRMCS